MRTPENYESWWLQQMPTASAKRLRQRKKRPLDPQPQKTQLMRLILVLLGVYLGLRGCYAVAGPEGFREFFGMGAHTQSTEVAPPECEVTLVEDLPRLFAEDHLGAQPLSEQKLVELMCRIPQTASFDCEVVEDAIARMDVDWDANAVKAAQSYLETFHMSRAVLLDQLSDPYGSGFTQEQAEYAVEQLDVDWRQNALETAREYRQRSALSDEDLFRYLTDPHREGFSEEEARWALDQLTTP